MSNQENLEKNRSSGNLLAIVKKVLWGIVYGVFAIVLVAVTWLGIGKFIMGSPVPSILGYATLTIETGSMESELLIGDLILIKDTGDYKIGDIVTYLHEGDKIPTTHRIINYTEGGFVTKGDANNVKDTDSVTEDMIIGEVVQVFPKVGLFSAWVKQEGWIYIVAILVIMALGSLIVRVENAPESEESEENKGETDSDNQTEEEINESTSEEKSRDDSHKD